MEFEARVVGGIVSCFVSLPLVLIQTLQSTRPDQSLPPILALELRSGKDRLWHVAWSGSASSSTAIEVAQQYAECISLPDHTTVQVRAVSNLPKADFVTIEPDTADDWEVLELNAELAEAAILKQVGIVYEAMRFPLWLHGQTVITFLVVSTSPKKPVVQLVPGSEVAVAPKRRQRDVGSYEDSSIQSSENEQFMSKALLRIQDADGRFTQRYEVNGVKMGVVVTSAVFVHSETAKTYAFNSLDCVIIVPRLLSKDNKKNHDTNSIKSKINSIKKEAYSGFFAHKDLHQAVVHILISDSVARGHIMLSQSLRLHLRAGLHSWIYVKRWKINLKKDIPAFFLYPCQLKTFRKGNAPKQNGLEGIESKKNLKSNNMLLRTNSNINLGTIDWSNQESIDAFFPNISSGKDAEEASKSNSSKGIASLLRAWCSAQVEIMSANIGKEVNSFILGDETLLHFQAEDQFVKSRTQASCDDCSRKGNEMDDSSVDMLYILSTTGGDIFGGKVGALKLTLDERNKEATKSRSLELLIEKIQLGDSVSLSSVDERSSEKCFNTTISSLSWMGTATYDIINRLKVLLSPASEKLFNTYNLPFPGHVLIYGPPGSGKTMLARAAAKYVEELEDILAHVILVSCSRLAAEKIHSIHQALFAYISEALDHAPSVIIFDDFDSIVASSFDQEGSQLSSSVTALTEFLTDIIDEYEEKRRSSCGVGPIAFIATAQSLTNIPLTLSSSGRFDFHVQLPSPAAAERGALLKHEIQKRSLLCSNDVLLDVAAKCDGYDAYDLEILVDRSVHAAIGRFLSHDLASHELTKPSLIMDDFLQAMHEFLPVAMRDITKPASDGGRSGWEDVGGLNDIQNAIKEMIELPSKFPNIFARAPLRLRSNVLLYGPPGCGKTHIVGAAAAACSLRFISIKGPELLNKYIGASEQAVRDIFTKAAAAAPCLLFFDEFDSIAPKRGHDNTGVTDRVVNQFLTELDGVEVLTGVFVFAATSRPDLLDAALLRPGRLDRLLFCDFPSPNERSDILRVLSRKLPLASDVDLEAIAHTTEGFSGADLQALLSDAQLAAVHNLLDGDDSSKSGKMPIITSDLLKSIASKARPSVSEAEKQRLYSIYSQFLDSKRSVAAQSRDAKGKRATLA